MQCRISLALCIVLMCVRLSLTESFNLLIVCFRQWSWQLRHTPSPHRCRRLHAQGEYLPKWLNCVNGYRDGRSSTKYVSKWTQKSSLALKFGLSHTAAHLRDLLRSRYLSLTLSSAPFSSSLFSSKSNDNPTKLYVASLLRISWSLIYSHSLIAKPNNRDHRSEPHSSPLRKSVQVIFQITYSTESQFRQFLLTRSQDGLQKNEKIISWVIVKRKRLNRCTFSAEAHRTNRK